jgi:ParB-like chromosome segregation protein Spo0J
MEIIKKRLIDLNPAEYNPRVQLQPGMPQYEKLRASIEEFGPVETLVWNRRTDTLVGGHQRLQVLTDMAIEAGDLETAEIEVVVVDCDRKKERALNLALNKITGLWDETRLGEVLKGLDDPLLDLSGFEQFEIEPLIKDFDPSALFTPAEPEPAHTVQAEPRTMVCPHCGQVIEL